jgi:uncharacterized membrane protein
MDSPRSFDRLVNFSDAVVAIAITLVVLPLVDTARDATDRSVSQFLVDNAPALGAAALSFVVIGNFWQTHHGVFDRFTGATRGMVRANFVWLAGIVTLPLPTVLLVGARSDGRLGTVLYIGTMLVSLVALAVVSELAERAGLVRADDAAPGDGRRRRTLRWLGAGLMALALVLAAAVPGVGANALFVLLATVPASRVGRRTRRARPAERPARRG